MTQAKEGDTVRIHYTGTLTDGTVFDSSEGRDPLEFTVGSGQIIPGLDKAMPGMAVGEQKRVEIGVMEAYGPAHADRVLEVPLERAARRHPARGRDHAGDAGPGRPGGAGAGDRGVRHAR